MSGREGVLREWTTENQGAAQHFRKAAREFQMPHGIFGKQPATFKSGAASPGSSLPPWEAVQHFRKAARDFEMPQSTSGKQLGDFTVHKRCGITELRLFDDAVLPDREVL